MVICLLNKEVLKKIKKRNAKISDEINGTVMYAKYSFFVVYLFFFNVGHLSANVDSHVFRKCQSVCMYPTPDGECCLC